MSPLTSLDVSFSRSHFPPLTDGWAFFENAGGSYISESVISRMTDYMRQSPVQHGAAFPTSELATARVGEAVAQMTELVNAEPDEIVISSSTSINAYVLAQVLRPLFKPGDEIIVTNQDHEANIGVWRRLAEFGVVIREWQVNPETADLDLADLSALLSKRTRLVCVAHVSNVIGSINDVRAIADMVHDVGGMVCVDGVAYAPHRLVDVKALDVDFYLLSLYKVYGLTSP